MYFYQVYYSDSFESYSSHNLLKHEKEYSTEEFDRLVSESFLATGSGTTFTEKIENYLITHYGFSICPITLSNTAKCSKNYY